MVKPAVPVKTPVLGPVSVRVTEIPVPSDVDVNATSTVSAARMSVFRSASSTCSVAESVTSYRVASRLATPATTMSAVSTRPIVPSPAKLGSL